MTNVVPGGTPPSKNDRRVAAREKAQQLRLEQKKKEKRNRHLIQGGIIVGVLAIVGAIVFGVIAAIPKTNPGPLNMLSDGIRIGESFVAETTPALQPGDEPVASVPSDDPEVVDIRIYLDYFCPACGVFEEANNMQIATWVDSGAAKLEIHPVSILDRASLGSQYSTRAANAAACVANYAPNNFFAYNALLFANQPDESTSGLSNDQLIKLAKTAEAESTDLIETCINEVRFKKWVNAATARAFEGPLPNADITKVEKTPTVLVNGQLYEGPTDDPTEFAKFVSTASGNAFTEELKSTVSPSPSPAP